MTSGHPKLRPKDDKPLAYVSGSRLRFLPAGRQGFASLTMTLL